MNKEDKILEISSRLYTIHKLRQELMVIYASDAQDYIDANEVLINMEEALWGEVYGN